MSSPLPHHGAFGSHSDTSPEIPPSPRLTRRGEPILPTKQEVDELIRATFASPGAQGWGDDGRKRGKSNGKGQLFICGHFAVGERVVPHLVVTFPVDNTLRWNLEAADSVVGVVEDESVSGFEVSVLAHRPRAQKEALGAGMELEFIAVGIGAFGRHALKAHVAREHHCDVKCLDFEVDFVAGDG